MFKELKVIKLLVLVGLLIAILLKVDFLNLTIYQLYTQKFSYEQGDVVQIYGSSKAKYPLFVKAPISDLAGNQLHEVELNLVQSTLKFDEILEQGDNIQEYVELKLSEQFKPGIYCVAGAFPIVVSGSNADVTIVYPHLNNLIYQKIEDQNCMSLNIPFTSLNRSAEVDQYTRGMYGVFDYITSTYSINYRTDIELEDYSRITDSKLLVIYGKSTFWTPKMKQNLKKFWSSGGNILLVSSYAANNVCWLDKENKRVQLFDANRADAIESYLGYDGDAPRFFIGSSYLFGGQADSSAYHISNPGHPIFKGIEGLRLQSKLYNSPPVEWKDEVPQLKRLDTATYSNQILAYGKTTTSYGANGVKGIFEYQPRKTHGKLLNLGSEDWCTAQDQKIIKNAVDYLLKESIK